MPNFTEFLAASPVCEYHLSNEQSALEGVLFSPSIEGGGGASAPQAPPSIRPWHGARVQITPLHGKPQNEKGKLYI